jgi:outer membrane autotransporter protein
MIDAGSIKNTDEKNAYLLSAVPRDLSETMNNNVQKVVLNSIANNVSLRMLTAGAADDLKTHSNIWAKGSYGAGTQEKSDIYSSSYDSTLFGGTVGVEFGLNDVVTFGAAVSYLQTEVKYNGLRKGDEDKFNSIIGSIYTMNQFNNNFILNGSIHFGNSTIEQKELKADKSIFSAPNLDAMSYSGSILGGYKAEYSSMSFTPLVGIGFSNFANPARKTVEGKFSAKASDTNRVDLIGGLAISGNIKTATMIVTPEIHGFAYYNINGDEKQNITLDIAGIPDSKGISYSSIEQTQTNFTIGGSVTAKTGMIEYGVSIDGQFADKYAGVLGSLKLKINL